MTQNIIQEIFNDVKQFIDKHKYDGACHDISAAFYLLLKENNIEAELMIGEVKTDDKFFDHSWVEINNEIYDIAISRPNVPSIKTPPVFASICTETKAIPPITYGAKSPVGLDDSTLWISKQTLEEYSSNHPFRENHLWDMVKDIRPKSNIKDLREKHGRTKRTIKQL